MDRLESVREGPPQPELGGGYPFVTLRVTKRISEQDVHCLTVLTVLGNSDKKQEIVGYRTVFLLETH